MTNIPDGLALKPGESVVSAEAEKLVRSWAYVDCITDEHDGGDLFTTLVSLISSALETARQAKDDEWIERARRYFVGVDPDPRKTLRERFGAGSVLADVVMHEVWKRDPNVEAAREDCAKIAQDVSNAAHAHHCELPPPEPRAYYHWLKGRCQAGEDIAEQIRSRPTPRAPSGQEEEHGHKE